MKGLLDVTEHGVLGDGVTDNTAVLGALTASLTQGGILFFPPGDYVTGSIRLYDNTTLYLCPGATLLGSENRDAFPLIEEGEIPGFNRRDRYALICAVSAKNITVEGGGRIDGRGAGWWQDVRDKKPVVRPRLFSPILCENVSLRNVTLVNSPVWTVNPVCCKGVHISGVTIKNPYDSPNTDGINPESCSDVRISDCSIDVGDDCVTIKSGKQSEPLMMAHPCENITVTGCTMLHGHGGVVIGSEMSGGVRNVTVTGCVFKGTDRGIRIKTRRNRGGTVEDLLFSGIIMKDVWVPLVINEYYHCSVAPGEAEAVFDRKPRPVDAGTPVIRGIVISDIVARGCECNPMYLLGLPESPIRDLRVSNFLAEMSTAGRHHRPIMTLDMPDTEAEGIVALNVRDCVMENVTLRNVRGDEYRFESCRNITYNGKQV